MSCNKMSGPKWDEQKMTVVAVKGECAYTNPHEVMLRLGLPEDAKMTPLQRSSFSYALHTFETQPFRYNIVFESQIPMLQERLQKAQTALAKKGQTPPAQVVWLRVDPLLQGKMNGLDEAFLKEVESQLKQALGELNVTFHHDTTPPAGPHSQIIFSPSEEDHTVIGDMLTSPYNKNPGRDPDIGNASLTDISYIKFNPKVLNDFEAVRKALHELGHQWGLLHAQAPVAVFDPTSKTSESGYKTTKAPSGNVVFPSSIMAPFKTDAGSMAVIETWGQSSLHYLKEALGVQAVKGKIK